MTDSTPEWMPDAKTPSEVKVTDKPREPVWDPRLGIEVEVSAGGAPRNRLVTVGDSLAHGFQGLAIHKCDAAIRGRKVLSGWRSHGVYGSRKGQLPALDSPGYVDLRRIVF